MHGGTPAIRIVNAADGAVDAGRQECEPPCVSYRRSPPGTSRAGTQDIEEVGCGSRCLLASIACVHSL